MQEQVSENYQRLLEKIRDLADELITTHPDCFPVVHEDGNWTPADGIPNTAACFAGILWQLHRWIGDEKWGNRAAYYSQLVLDADPTMPSWQAWIVFHPWYRFKKESAAHRLLIEHGQNVARSNQRRGQFVSDANDSARISASSMLDIPLMFYAANETLDQDLGRFATAHCRTARDVLLSDPAEPRAAATYDADQKQFAGDAQPCLPVHLAMMMRGFVHVFQVTHMGETLDTAERIGQLWIERLPEDRIPAASPSAADKDYLATTLAASALLDLAELSKTASHQLIFKTTALASLDALVDAAQAGHTTIEGQYFLTESLAKVVSHG